MKSYPSIARDIRTDVDIIAFDKLDGSNLRAEWSPKRGFYKFGTRKRLLDENDTHLGKGVVLFKEIYAPKMPKIFARQRWHQSVVCFFEFHGPHSFAGQHRRKDNHTVTLFDVAVHKKGLLPPKEFMNLFIHLGIPKVLYRGKANQDFVRSVRESTLPHMTLEGVVCKAPNPKKKKSGKPIMFKVKSQAWLDKLKEECGENEGLFEKLK
jgi:hypothetical protein